MDIVISPSTKKNKKYKAVINNDKTIHFGHTQYQDFTTHKDTERKERYIARHKKNEDWTKTGVDTAGFMSRWITWNKDTIEKSVQDLNKKYKDINFKYKK